MTDSDSLRKEIKNSGYLYKFIASKLGITTYGLQRKIDNLSEFKASEIAILSQLLNLTESKRTAIFFTIDSDL